MNKENIIKKGICKKCGEEYGIIGLDILELCVSCIDKECGENDEQ